MKGLLFSEPMVKAWMEGRKTVTRRMMNPQPEYQWADGKPAFMQAEHTPKPPYLPGETVYIRETWGIIEHPERVVYRANPADDYQWGAGKPSQGGFKWKSPRFMPEWAARSHALIKNVRPERVKEITREEALREGKPADAMNCPTMWFQTLWESLHPGSWERNDFVWRYELEQR